MPDEIPTINPQDAMKLVIDELTAVGWKELSERHIDVAQLLYEGNMWQMVRYNPQERIPYQFQWYMYAEQEGEVVYIDFADQIQTLLSIIAEFAPQTKLDNYRGVIAALAKLLPAIYIHDDDKLMKINLQGWE